MEKDLHTDKLILKHRIQRAQSVVGGIVSKGAECTECKREKDRGLGLVYQGFARTQSDVFKLLLRSNAAFRPNAMEAMKSPATRVSRRLITNVTFWIIASSRDDGDQR